MFPRDSLVEIRDPTPLRMALLSALYKSFVLKDLIMSRKLDFLFLTETWQRNIEDVPLTELCLMCYIFISSPRISGRSGGRAIVFRSHFVCHLVSTGPFSFFKLQMIKV